MVMQRFVTAIFFSIQLAYFFYVPLHMARFVLSTFRFSWSARQRNAWPFDQIKKKTEYEIEAHIPMDKLIESHSMSVQIE